MVLFREWSGAYAVLGSYVDDAFGGALCIDTAQKLINFVSELGASHGAGVNHAKTCGSATSIVILGLLYNSRTRVCSLDTAKVAKYSKRIRMIINNGGTTSKGLEKIIGNLAFAAWVEPFGRPLLSFLAAYVIPDKPATFRPLTEMMQVAFRV